MRQMKLIYFYLSTLCGFYSVSKSYNVQSVFEQSQMHSSGLYGVRSSGNVLLCSRYLTHGSLAHGVQFWASHGKSGRVKTLFSSIFPVVIFPAPMKLKRGHSLNFRQGVSGCLQQKKEAKLRSWTFPFLLHLVKREPHTH